MDGNGGSNGGYQESHFLPEEHLPNSFAKLPEVKDFKEEFDVNSIPLWYSSDGWNFIKDLDKFQGEDSVSPGRVAEKIMGTDSKDLIAAGLNDDHVMARAGNDRVWGGSGDDRLEGGVGNDTLLGGSGDDWLFGGAGNDSMDEGRGFDTAYFEEFGERVAVS